MDTLCNLLKENIELYESILELEYQKYDAVMKNDIKLLDDTVSKEQVSYLKIRGLEQKREKLLESLGMSHMTLKEIIDSAEKNKDTLKKQYDELNSIITELKKINSLSKTVIEARLHKIDKTMVSLGEKENTYSDGKNKSKSSKGLLISQKI